MTEMQAAIALEEFSVLDTRMAGRREWAAHFGAQHGIRDIGNRDWFVYPTRCESARRGDLARRLGGRVGYHEPLWQLPYFKSRGYSGAMLPNTAKIADELVVVNPLCL